MYTRRSQILITLFLPFLLTLTGCEFSWMGPTATSHCSATAELSAGDVVEIETRNGSVRVILDPSLAQAEIEADIRCGGNDLEDAKFRAESSQIAAQSPEEGRFRIEPAFPGGILPQDAASLSIRLPYAAEIRVTTSNGAVMVQGAAGAVTGNVSVVSSNGPVEVRDVEGDVAATSSNGPIVAASIGGAVTARTSNGPVHVKDAVGRVTADTSNGSVVFQGGDFHEGPVVLDTSNAPISATFGPQFRGRVEMDTSNARIRVSDVSDRIVKKHLQKSDGYLVIGDGSTESRLDTSNGSITVEIR